jgi:LacI family transcriptional regulator
VQIGRHFNKLEANYVICNDELGGYQATKYLLSMGHRDILILTGPSYVSSARERLAGYRKAFKEQKLPVNSRLIRTVPITGCSEVIAGILREKIHFTAIFAFSDLLAWDAWTCLKKAGYKIPDDCSLIGFDNIQSRLAIPIQLSTISSYKAKMSITAVEYLLRVIKDRQGASEDPSDFYGHVIDTELVEGETVCPLSGSY